MKSLRASDALKPEREGILAVLHEPSTIDRIQGVIRELQLDDELSVTDSLDAALRRIRSGSTPRILLIDLGESTAPIAEVSAARAVGGIDLKLVVLGTVNDVALFRDLLSAGASDYLVKPSTREALTAVLEKSSAPTPDGLGQVIVFLGSRGGVGATTSAVSCAWLMATERRERVALVDLDLHFGTVALKLDLDPGSGLCEALEQPSRIDSLFIERAMIKVSDNLRVLAAEASAAQHVAVDPGAIDMLLHELRRKFVRVIVDLPRGVSPMHRVVLAARARWSSSASTASPVCATRSGCRLWCASRRPRPVCGSSRRAPPANALRSAGASSKKGSASRSTRAFPTTPNPQVPQPIPASLCRPRRRAALSCANCGS
jgi:CheY-like chemotaxis protein